MAHTRLHQLLPAAILLAAAAALAPSARAAGAAAPDPTDPAAATAPQRHSSPFKTYREAPAGTTIGWLEANREVAAIGGWRAYGREAQAPEATAAAGSGRAAPPARPAPPASASPGARPPPVPMEHDHGTPTPGARP